MEPFEIQWRASTKKDLRKLPPQEVARIVAAVEALAQEPFPHGSEKLSGSEHTYRIRVGDYRVVYAVFTESRIVEIQRARHRKDVYRR
jgi:mRNA interferase RelE/StbE